MPGRQRTTDKRSKRDADRPLTHRWRNKTGINQTNLDRRLFNSPGLVHFLRQAR